MRKKNNVIFPSLILFKSLATRKKKKGARRPIISVCLILNPCTSHIWYFLQVNSFWLLGWKVKYCTVFINNITTYTGTRWAIRPFPPRNGYTKICPCLSFRMPSVAGEKVWDKLPFPWTISDTPSTNSSPVSSHLYPALGPPQLHHLYSAPPSYFNTLLSAGSSSKVTDLQNFQ